MPIIVKIMKRAAGGRSTLYATRDLEVLPVSIGRDAACTIALEDPNKHMSRFHVEIEEESGTYWMSVVSKVNPVMVKGRRYGPGTRLTLQSGDSFEIADYEVQVLLPEPAPAPATDDAERLFNESTFSRHEPRAPAPKLIPDEDAPAEATFIPTKAKAASALADATPAPGASSSPRRAPADDDVEKLFNESTFGDDEPKAPAPKLIPDEDAPAEATFIPTKAGRAPPSATPAPPSPEDLRSHELALMAGMRAAILGALRRIDPSVLESALEKGGKGFSLASRKAKLWDLFVEQQGKLARETQEDFTKAFGRDFMGAYEAELQRLKGGR